MRSLAEGIEQTRHKVYEKPELKCPEQHYKGPFSRACYTCRAIKEEREACALLVEDLHHRYCEANVPCGCEYAVSQIRARGE